MLDRMRLACAAKSSIVKERPCGTGTCVSWCVWIVDNMLQQVIRDDTTNPVLRTVVMLLMVCHVGEVGRLCSKKTGAW